MIKTVYLSLFIMLFQLTLCAQNSVKIKGRVVDAVTNRALVDVVVSSADAKEMVLTDSLGRFQIEMSRSNGMINISKQGYETRKYQLAKLNDLEIFLTRADRASQKISKAIIGSKPFESEIAYAPDLFASKKGGNFADELLHGTVPGLYSVSKGGMPGEGTMLNLRGLRSLVGDNSPLIVIDGLVYAPQVGNSDVFAGYSPNSLLSVAAKNVDKITFLKGFSASAYGSLGSNGVIYIETENPSDLETRVTVQSTNGISFMPQTLPALASDDYRGYLYDVASTTLTPNAITEKFPFLVADEKSAPLYFNDTKWSDYIYAPAFSTNNLLTIKGGDAIAKYALNFGYIDQKGVLKNTGLSRYYTRMNATMNVSPKMSLFANIALGYTTRNLADQSNATEINPVYAAMLKPSILSPWLKDGQGNSYDVFDQVRDFGLTNPAALVEQVDAESSSFDYMTNLGFNLAITNALALKFNGGVYYDFYKEDLFIPGITYNTIAPLDGGMAKNTVKNASVRSSNYYANLNLSYQQSWKNHAVVALLGGHFLYDRKSDSYAKGINTASDYDNTFAGVKEVFGRAMHGSIQNQLWANGYGQIGYGWNNLFFVGGNVAIEQSSFSTRTSEQIGVYPSVSGNFNFSNLAFFKKGNLIENLNLRAEYGLTSNSRISTIVGAKSYSGNPFMTLGAIVPVSIATDGLLPERIYNQNIGVDLRTKGNKFSISIDLFNEEIKDLIISKKVALEQGKQISFVNGGEMTSRGVDISMHKDILNTNRWHWRVGGNVSYIDMECNIPDVELRNESLYDGCIVGHPAQGEPLQFYGYKSNGVISSTSEAEALGLTDYKNRSFDAGDIAFADLDGNHIINEKDKTYLGSVLPDLFGSIYTTVRYGNLFLSAQFTGAMGHSIYNHTRRLGESMTDYSNQLNSVNHRWMIEGQQTSIPRAQYGDPMENGRFSSRWIEDGDYIKLKKVVLSYTWPKSLGFIHQIETYIEGENLFTLTDYKGVDPEVALSNYITDMGIDAGKVANPSTIQLGIKLNF